jgi:hypothetical protein
VVLSCRWPHGVAGGGAAERLAEERRFVRDREERSLRHCARVISGGMVDSIGTTDWRASCSEIEGGVRIAQQVFARQVGEAQAAAVTRGAAAFRSSSRS